MRPLAISVFFLLCCAGSTACGVLTGLNGFKPGEDPDGGAPSLDGGGVNGESSTPADDAETDGSTAEDDASASDETGVMSEGGAAINDSGLSSDSRPVCSTLTCPGGCCNASGDCVGGHETAACGSGAADCTDCSTSGQVCTNNACAAPKPDASAPATCTSSSCPACGSLQLKCCTSNHVCGCDYPWPSSCQ